LRLPLTEALSAEVSIAEPPAVSLALRNEGFASTFLEKGGLDAVMADQGIERSDLASSYLLFQAEKALKKAELTESIRLGKAAATFSPLSSLPFFFLADVYWKMGRGDSFTATSYYFKGFALALGDVLFLLPFLSQLFFLSLIALLLATATFILYSLMSYAPLWAHQISEKSSGILNPISALFCFAIIFFLPVIFGFPILWLILFSFLLFWPFYSRGEKGIVFTLLLALGTTTWALPLLITLFTARNSLLIDEMARNHYSEYFLAPLPAESVGSEWEDWFIRASYEAQQGNREKATYFYQNALGENPQSASILNNLGNLSFYAKNYQEAIKYYQEAIKTDPSIVSSRFNLSQTYREMLMFDEGEAFFLTAKGINEKTAKAYAMKAVRHPDFPVVEEHFVLEDIWRRFLEKNEQSLLTSKNIWKNWAGQIPLSQAPLLAFLWATLLFISSFLHKHLFFAIPCAFCKKAICKSCATRLFSYEVCEGCRKRYRSIQKKSDFWIIEDAVKKVPKRLYLLFFLPGAGHLVIRNVKTAALFLLAFYMAITSFFFGEDLIPPTEWYLHRAGSYFPQMILLILCIMAFIDLIIKRKARKWL